ncbi:MAG TPA: acetyl-CoA carboxylase biotin carboxyl carrier protein [Vicinamibacterales bacterium]|jgi:acetyl-CoA carboxylase biotin carboxyl carrier protein
MTMMKIDEIRQILDLVREHELSELELESDGVRIRIKKGGQAIVQAAAIPVGVPTAPAGPTLVATAAAEQPSPEIEIDSELAIVKSPIVGTFYRAPEPNAPPFVQPGDSVKNGQTLCIIEAMKMMNNIDSEYAGTVVKVYAENGQPVQYGERLFAIKR